MQDKPNKTVQIVRVYMTERGTLGVRYKIGQQNFATFAPSTIRNIAQLRGWLADNLGMSVAPANTFLSGIDTDVLESLVAATPTSAQPLLLSNTDSMLQRLKPGAARHQLHATVSSSSDATKTYRATIDLRSGRSTCTCPASKFRQGTCKHAALVAKTLLALADTSTPAYPTRPNTINEKLERVYVAITDSRLGFIKLSLGERTCWVDSRSVFLERIDQSPGQTRAMLLVPPGHALLNTLKVERQRDGSKARMPSTRLAA